MLCIMDAGDSAGGDDVPMSSRLPIPVPTQTAKEFARE